MSSRLRSAHGARTTRGDVSLLKVSDRACLRLLERARVCTAEQLGSLVYPSKRTALRRTRNLWQQGLVVRVPLPAERGGTPLAYRLSETGRRRIHSPMLRSTGLVTAQHSLDGVELVASLVRHDPGLVQLWYTEWLIPELGDGINPDQLVVLDTGDASALVLVEVDESTERPPIIRERLKAYAHLLVTHPTGWHLLWVVNSPDRLLRIRQIAGPMKLQPLGGRCWGVAIGEVTARGGSAETLPVGFAGAAKSLRSIAVDPRARRMTPTPGTSEWVAFIAAGALEAWTAEIHDGVARDGPDPVAAALAVSGVSSPESTIRLPQTAPRSHGSPDAPSARRVFPSQPVERLDPVLLTRTNRDLAELILAQTTHPDRAIEAARILRDHLDWSGLEAVATVLCTSSEPQRIRLGIAIIERAPPITVGPWQTCRKLLLGLIDPERGADICNAAIAALGRLAERRP